MHPITTDDPAFNVLSRAGEKLLIDKTTRRRYPASPSLTIDRICSSLNLLRFIGPPRFWRTLILCGVADYRGQVT
jgi:hypothetical protein